MKKNSIPGLTALALAVTLATAGPATAQTFVASANPTPTVLGAIIAGQSYSVTTTGISDLYDSFNSGQGLTFTADGIPTYAFPSPYNGMSPNGSSSALGYQCVGGATPLCGALIGAFVPTLSTTPINYFMLGSSYSFTAASSGFLVGLVNDVNVAGAYNDNGAEGFTVTLSNVTQTGAVPEPATWAMMIAGFATIGASLRRRMKTADCVRVA